MLGNIKTQLKQNLSKASLKKRFSRELSTTDEKVASVTVVSPPVSPVLEGSHLVHDSTAESDSSSSVPTVIDELQLIVALGHALSKSTVTPQPELKQDFTSVAFFNTPSTPPPIPSQPTKIVKKHSDVEIKVREFQRRGSAIFAAKVNNPSINVTVDNNPSFLQELETDFHSVVGSIVLGFDNGMKVWPQVWLRGEDFSSVVERLEYLIGRC